MVVLLELGVSLKDQAEMTPFQRRAILQSAQKLNEKREERMRKRD